MKKTQYLMGFVGAVVVLGVCLPPRAIAQLTEQEFLKGRAREACVLQAERQGLRVNQIVTTIPTFNTNGQMAGAEVIMTVTRSGAAADVRCNFDAASNSAVIANVPPGGGSSAGIPTEGIFQGRGIATGSVFGNERVTDASLSFNQQNNFGFSLAVPPGTGAQVQYSGTINRIRRAGSGNSQNFVLQGRVRSFASSADGLRATAVTGTCEIEVFDARVISSDCNTRLRNSGTRFEGLLQF